MYNAEFSSTPPTWLSGETVDPLVLLGRVAHLYDLPMVVQAGVDAQSDGSSGGRARTINLGSRY